MLAKTVEKSGCDWDEELPYILFEYRSRVWELTQESPILLYGRDPQLPTEGAPTPPVDRCNMELQNYHEDLVSRLGDTCQLARSHMQKAQRKQKEYCDLRSIATTLNVHGRVSFSPCPIFETRNDLQIFKAVPWPTSNCEAV